MQRTTIKSQIEDNRKLLNQLLSGHSMKRLNSLNWVRHEFMNEATTLFQIPDHFSKTEKQLYLDYTSMANLCDAWDYIVKNKNIDQIDNYQVRNIHSILCKGTNIPGGVYRVSEAFVEQLGVHAPSFEKLPYILDTIQYNLSDKRLPPLTQAFKTHYDLIELQPFNDFNKRTARMIMNWVLLKNDYRPILFNDPSDKQNYMAALRSCADGGGYSKEYSNYMYKCLLRTQNSILKILQRSHIQ